MPTSTAAIISCGNELILGSVVDTNTAWLAARLAELGIPTSLHVTVGDDEDDIRKAVLQAADKAETVIVSGGLGPTLDDVTRQAVAGALGVGMVEDPACLEHVKAFFAKRGRVMPDTNRVQALIPVGARPIHNSCGTAPGIRAQLGRSTIYVVPGVPFEMREMFTRSIQLELLAKAGGRAVQGAKILCFGAGESDIANQIADLMKRGRNPLVGTTPHEMIIGVRVVATGSSPAEATDLLQKDLAEIRRRLGDLVYGEGDDTLAESVGRMLIDAKLTVATAESCTGGWLAKSLTDLSGSSAYLLRGYVTYSNQAKSELLGVPAAMIEQFGAVSEEVARAMAMGCKARARTHFSIGITGIAGPTGGSAEKPVGLVYIAMAGPNGVEARKVNFGEHLQRWQIRDRATKAALNMLRLALLAGRQH
jgi:nicotinamide-nucleotide amidase